MGTVILLLGGKDMSALAVHTFDDPSDEAASFEPAILIRRTDSADLLGTSLATFGPRYAAIMRNLCRARSRAAKRCDWVRFRDLSDEVAMIGAVIAHQSQLRGRVAS